MKILLTTFFLLIYSNVIGQEYFVSSCRNNIKPIELYFQNILENNNYIIYCSKVKLLLYIHFEDNYYEIIFEGSQDREKFMKGSNDVDYTLKAISLIDKDLMSNVFNKDKYAKGYSDASIIDSTKGLITLDGLPTYFVYKENINEAYAEYALSIVIRPVPMDFNIYKFFTSRMINIDIGYDDW